MLPGRLEGDTQQLGGIRNVEVDEAAAAVDNEIARTADLCEAHPTRDLTVVRQDNDGGRVRRPRIDENPQVRADGTRAKEVAERVDAVRFAVGVPGDETSASNSGSASRTERRRFPAESYRSTQPEAVR